MQGADARGDDPRLVVLVLGLDHAHGLAAAELAPEPLLDTPGVVLDDGVGGVEDALRGAVVLLEPHHARVREVALEVEDVADVGAAPGVDRLVGVADDEDVAVRVGEQAHDAVLRVVRVLVLVDEQVVEHALPALAHVVEALEQLDGAHQQVVEVHRVGGVQPALVELEDVGHDLIEEVADVLAELCRGDEAVLLGGDARVDAARREALRVAPELLEARLHDAHLVGLVVDREVRAVAEAIGLAPQDASAGRVERHHPHAARLADELLDALPHLGRGAVRERDREHLVRAGAALAEQVADARGEHARLARARAGDHERGAVGQRHRLALGGVETSEQLVVGVGGHAHVSTIATPHPDARSCIFGCQSTVSTNGRLAAPASSGARPRKANSPGCTIANEVAKRPLESASTRPTRRHPPGVSASSTR